MRSSADSIPMESRTKSSGNSRAARTWKTGGGGESTRKIERGGCIRRKQNKGSPYVRVRSKSKARLYRGHLQSNFQVLIMYTVRRIIPIGAQVIAVVAVQQKQKRQVR